MNSLSLEGKVAIVTGGTRGIGLGIVRAYLEQGAYVAFTGQTPESIDVAHSQLARSESCFGMAANFSDAEAPRRVVEGALQRFGKVDVLINNAGVIGPNDIWKTDAAAWDYVHAVNVRAVFLCAQEASKAMMAAGNGGSIVNISSVAAQIGGTATGTAYVSSKAAQIGITRSLARHLASHRIRVNCIAPADIETDMIAGWSAELREKLIQMTPLARFGTADEVAMATIFLGSEAASYITGQTLNVNGGLYMG